MKKKIVHYQVLFVFVIIFFSSCYKEGRQTTVADAGTVSADKLNSSIENVFKGPEIQMGNGKARSWISINHDGVPVELGIEMTDGALYGLPQDPEDVAAATFVLPLHKKASDVTPFDHLVINWNVQGHEPKHVFDVPHFDFHFYMISEGDRMAIPPYEVAPAGFDKLPPHAYWPDLYFPTPGGVPQMGKHWIDGTFAPPFTKTFIYGSYNGRFTFLEPMVIRDYLVQGTSYTTAFRQLHVFDPVNKYYPQQYNIYKDPVSSKHYVTLSDFVWR
ncbi:DUF5602 domain-containing protein [Ferruginibacter paludis]|uniref:DUF5602 domain-containing protein n=1 Tax=Ferruginibacter paludis TaxID=1310417 RepID=UPI0025B3A792|nr:DUF5602 domain-containing protein [Ferruginibacter paludis]MDN3659488.1 DUF5602 domain-containing protein [Ferruginibacter paludis]